MGEHKLPAVVRDDDVPRVPFITSREQVPDGGAENYDYIADTRERVTGPYAVLLNSPEVAERVAHLGTYLRFESVLPGPLRELAILTTAREFNCAYEWAAHEPIARREGTRDEAIEAVASNGSLDELTETEALVVRYGRELFRDTHVSNETFRAAQERFGDDGVSDLTVTLGYYSLIASVLNALQVLPEPEADSLPDD